jgi:hypothetical protein
MTGYIISGLLIAIGIFFYIRYAQKYTKRFAHVGLCAAQTYIMFGDTAALCATRAVSAAMSKNDKDQLLNFIAQITIKGDGIDEELASQRRSQLLMHIKLDKNGVAESVAFKKELKLLSEDWLSAVMKCDYEIATNYLKKLLLKILLAT